MDPQIIVVGSLNMDLVVRTDRLPRPGETVMGRDFEAIPGGKGANQAIAAARLGGRVAMVGKVGSDEFGNRLCQELALAGIYDGFVTRDADAPTGVALITVETGGQNSIVVAPGANMRVSPADVNAAAELIGCAQIMLLQLECPLETVVHAAELAHRHGLTVILNPAPALPLPPALLRTVNLLIPNETETALLAGRPISTAAEVESAARALSALGPGRVIVTLGEKGALLAGLQGTTHVPAFAVDAVDATAAGDAFMGALAVALAEGHSLPDAMRWGNAAGALTASKAGAQTSLPSRDAVESLLRDARPR